MRKKLALALCGALLLAATARTQNPRKDEVAIRGLAAQWQQAWDRNDAKTLANLLSVDADYVTEDGTWLRGRADFGNWRARFRQSATEHRSWDTNHLTFRFLQPDIAILHLTWTITTSPQMRSPGESRAGISTWILVKLGNGWRIRAAQDTEVSRSAP